MTRSAEQTDKPSVKARLKELLDDISTSIDHASEEEQRRLLSSLEELQQDDRRRDPRKGCSIAVTYATWRIFTDFIKNISAGGVFIETSVPFARGENLTLMFSPPNQQEAVKITGQVVWSDPNGVGVKFTSPPSKELEEILESL
jgi:Tfp pilus assembly protein PilZ